MLFKILWKNKDISTPAIHDDDWYIINEYHPSNEDALRTALKLMDDDGYFRDGYPGTYSHHSYTSGVFIVVSDYGSTKHLVETSISPVFTLC